MPFSRLLALAVVFLLISMTAARAESTSLWSLERGMDLSALQNRAESVPPGTSETIPTSSTRVTSFSPVQLLTALANKLRDIRYRRGGRQPSTGFDCSGFVRYVFHLGAGIELPRTSAAQYQEGQQVARNDLRIGDLVFFRTAGKRVSHVGIYLGDDSFIHSPSAGKRVSVSSLLEPYWSRHFAGGRRSQALAAQMNASANPSIAMAVPGA